jgi:hypothetical protein
MNVLTGVMVWSLQVLWCGHMIAAVITSFGLYFSQNESIFKTSDISSIKDWNNNIYLDPGPGSATFSTTWNLSGMVS